jgi:hypothetical protein
MQSYGSAIPVRWQSSGAAKQNSVEVALRASAGYKMHPRLTHLAAFVTIISGTHPQVAS